MKNHLIIVAHPNQDSFTQAMASAVCQASEQTGAKTVVRDLYALSFQPILTLAEMKGSLPNEILQEQQYIREADLITLIYPLWWMGFPAILKGYLDRVLTYGFAYEATKEGSRGLLNNKKMQQFINIGNNVDKYQEKGFAQSLDTTLVNGLFQYCGITDICHQFFGDLHIVDNLTRQAMLNSAVQKTKENLTAL